MQDKTLQDAINDTVARGQAVLDRIDMDEAQELIGGERGTMLMTLLITKWLHGKGKLRPGVHEMPENLQEICSLLLAAGYALAVSDLEGCDPPGSRSNESLRTRRWPWQRK